MIVNAPGHPLKTKSRHNCVISSPMLTYTDQLNRQIHLPHIPRKIISLVPSQTELLIDLGASSNLVGITKFCIHPAAAVKNITKIGGTKQINLEQIKQLKPDLIIGNKEENERLQIEHLMNEFPVWLSDIYNLPDALQMISLIGKLINKSGEAENLITEVTGQFSLLPTNQTGNFSLKVAYFIWKDPFMVAGNQTFIHDIITRAGWQNAFTQNRYPQISLIELEASKPDLIFLSSEPYPFKQKHIDQFKEVCPASKVMLVDGEMFSWYGSRLKFTAAYLQQLSNKIKNLC